MGYMKKAKYTERMTFATSVEQMERIKKLVVAKHLNISHLLREALENALLKLEG